MNAVIIKKNNNAKNIYKQLEEIQVNTISQRGLGLERQFKTRCIKGFVNQGIIQAKLLKQIKEEINPTSKEAVVIEMNHLCKKDNIAPIERIDYFHKGNKQAQNPKPIIPNLYDLLAQKNISEQYREAFLLSPQERKLRYLKESNSHKRFTIDPYRLNLIRETKNKMPMFGMYSPNYNAINPHIPYAKLYPISVEVSPRVKFIKDKLSKSSGNTLSNRDMKSQSQSPPQRTVNNTNECNNSINEGSDSGKKNEVFIHVRSFEKYSPRKDTTRRLYDESKIKPYKSSKPTLNLSVPNFKLMLPRKKISHRDEKIPAMIDYNPDYTAIFTNKLGSKKLNEIISKKKLLIQKILRSSNPPSYYLSVPEINNIKRSIPDEMLE